MRAAIDFLTDLAGKLQTQDNAYTASPNYCIQENRLVCGVDEDYGGQVGWFDDEATHPAEGKKHAALERYYRLFDKEPRDWRRISYEFKWRYCGISFLTHDAAHAYVKEQRHRHTYEIRVYVDSHYRNHEMREVRRLLSGPVQECIAQLEAMLKEDDGGMQAQYAKAALAALDTATEPQRSRNDDHTTNRQGARPDRRSPGARRRHGRRENRLSLDRSIAYDDDAFFDEASQLERIAMEVTNQ